LCEKKQNVVKSLLEDFIYHGGDVNVKNDDGWTLLQYAVLFEHNPAIVKLLLEKGANAKAKSSDGVPTITCVKSWCSPSFDDGGSSAGGHNHYTIGLPIMKLLLDNGASIDEIHPGTSFTMLHGALLDENYVFAKELLALGASPNIKNMNGDTSLKLVLRFIYRRRRSSSS
jgi:ankyrin repeat protein